MSDHKPDPDDEQPATNTNRSANQLDAQSPPAGWPSRLIPYYTAMVELDAVTAGKPDNFRAVGVTSTELAESDTGSTSDRSNASRNLKKLADDETVPVDRRADGNSYHYWINSAKLGDGDAADETETDATGDATDETDATGDATGDGLIPMLGDGPSYDDQIPADVPEYADPSDILLSIRMLATDRARDKGDSPTSLRLIGHTGAGKTHAPRYVAAERDAACVVLQCSEGTDGTDILGESVPVGGDWCWRDGRVTEAFRLSQEGLTFLIIDEFNRMRPEAASAVMSALGRGMVDLSERNETVHCDPSNLVIIGTQNPPTAEYVGVFDGDFAQARRWGRTKNVPYLGEAHFDRAVSVARRESPDVTEAFAELVVDTANELRAFCDAQPDATSMSGAVGPTPERDVKLPVPTGAVKETVDTADMLADVDHPDAGLEAARQAILETIYVESDAYDWVAQRLTDRFSGVDPWSYDGAGDGETHTPHRDGDAGPDAGGDA